MKKSVLLILFLSVLAFSLSGENNSEKRQIEWQLSTGLSFMPGLLFANEWDPGYSGSAFTLLLSGEYGRLSFGTGVEAGLTYSGITLLFPLRAGFIIAKGSKIGFSIRGSFLPGMIMARPIPYFLVSGEIGAELEWFLTDRIALAFSAGPRYTASPSYGSAVAPYSLLDIVAGINLAFQLGEVKKEE